MKDQELLFILLDTELTSKQQQIVEEYLYDVLVKERLDKYLEYIKSVVDDELTELSYKEVVDILKDKLG